MQKKINFLILELLLFSSLYAMESSVVENTPLISKEKTSLVSCLTCHKVFEGTNAKQKLAHHKQSCGLKLCKKCNKTFEKPAELFNHVADKHGYKLYEYDKDLLKKPYQCTKCKERFQFSGHCTRHVITSKVCWNTLVGLVQKTSKLEKELICTACNKQFGGTYAENSFRQHQAMCGIKICTLCSQEFTRPQNVVDHIQYDHNKSLYEKNTTFKEAIVYSCLACKKDFLGSEKSAKTHCMRHIVTCKSCPTNKFIEVKRINN